MRDNKLEDKWGRCTYGESEISGLYIDRYVFYVLSTYIAIPIIQP